MIFGRDPGKAEQAWKKKYYDSLEKLERKEKEWGHAENVMRNAMSRLSVVMDGQDPNLDRELDLLRHAIRRGADAEKIIAILASVLETVEQVEALKAKQPKLRPADALDMLADRIPFPKGITRKAKGLKKSIARLGEQDDPRPVIVEFSELLAESFAWLDKQASSEKEKDAGFIDPVKPSTSPEVDLSIAPVQGSTGTDLAARKILEDLLSAIHLPKQFEDAIKRVRDRLHSIRIEDELNRLTIDLANVLNAAVPLEESHGHMESLLHAESGTTINEILLQLLERIELPAEVSNEVARIQHELEGEVREEDWPRLLESISMLIRSMRENAHKEKKSLEAFLTQLTEQLQALDIYIGGIEQDRQDSLSNGQNLDNNVSDQIRNIEDSMQQASELEQLKGLIRNRLETIAGHMEHFRGVEQARDQQAQERIQELNDRIRKMEKESEELQSKVIRERELAHIDPLTQVRNRMAYMERMELDYARWKRYQTPLSLIVIDIDFFKKINDNYGHIAGDKVLHTIAQLLLKNIRETDFLARYGGEEFVIVMPDTHTAAALGVAEKLRMAVETCGFHYRGESVPITISCGVSEFGENSTPATVFEQADKALYRAKEEGRNRCKASGE